MIQYKYLMLLYHVQKNRELGLKILTAMAQWRKVYCLRAL
jgi:hypothetical protein